MYIFLLIFFPGIDETVSIVKSMGGYCKGYKVDISKKDEVYRYADEIRNNIGDVRNVKIYSIDVLIFLRSFGGISTPN